MWFILLFVIVVNLGAIIYYWLPEWLRSRAFRRLARELGLQYVRCDTSIPRKYRFLDDLRRGFARCAMNVLKGEYQGYLVQTFDYRYQTLRRLLWDSGRSLEGYQFTFLLLEQDRSFPEVLIHPRGRFTTLGQALKLPKVDFESVEFSRAFAVKSRDRKFAYDICHPRMIEYFLEHRDLSLEVEGRCVAMSFDRRLKPEEIPGRLNQLVEIRQLFPEYLYRA